MLRVGALGPPIEITDQQAKDIVTSWRSSNPFVVANWKATQNMVKQAFVAKMRVEHGVVIYEGRDNNVGWMHLPGGMAIRYDGLEVDEEGGLSYISEYRVNKIKPPTIKRTRLYGGIEVENRTQALARRVIAEHALAIGDELKRCKPRLAMSTHDEVVFVVPDRSAQRALRVAKEIMSTPPSWAPDLPLAADVHLSKRYDK
jgi:DNA polymerase